VMHGRRKLIAREWEQDWLCYDTAHDPEERKPLPSRECVDLREHAERVFQRLPGKG